MSRLTLAALRRSLAALRRIAPLERATAGSREGPGRMLTDGGPGGREDDDHLRNVPDGAGCTEIWEYLSERPGTGSDD